MTKKLYDGKPQRKLPFWMIRNDWFIDDLGGNGALWSVPDLSQS